MKVGIIGRWRNIRGQNYRKQQKITRVKATCY